MASEMHLSGDRKYRRRCVIMILFLMVLVNLAVRYPLDHAVPHGSDTFFILELGNSLANQGHASWVLSPSSYFGLYPLSYPCGVPFTTAEVNLLGDCDWNAIPLAFSMFFTVLLVLGGFMLFRAFSLNDKLSAVLAGLMALSPAFMYYTYEQASGRGFAVPILVLCISIIFMNNISNRKAGILLLAFSFCSVSVHRSGFILLLFIGLALSAMILSQSLSSMIRRKTHHGKRVRSAVYGVVVASIVVLFLWPFVPGVSDRISDVEGFSSIYRMAEYEFSTGILMDGDTSIALLVNLSTNYVGSIGLALLLLPFGVMALYPASLWSRARDVFLLMILVVVAPVLWKAQYMTPIMLPFFYLLAGLAIQRRSNLLSMMPTLLRKRIAVRRVHCPLLRYATTFMVVAIILASTLFSAILFVHRENIPWSVTGVTNWPTDDEIGFGSYLRVTDVGGEALFVSPQNLLDRQIGWFSQWNSPVTDPPVLRADGYLNATAGDFFYPHTEQLDFLEVFTSFYTFAYQYDINSSLLDRYRYYLSWDDGSGYYRLYFDDPDTAWLGPRISTALAGISIVVMVNEIGEQVPNKFTGVGVKDSPFLQEIGSSTYILYRNHDYSGYLAAALRSAG